MSTMTVRSLKTLSRKHSAKQLSIVAMELSLREAFYRQNLPNATNLLATVLIFLIVIYFQDFQVALQCIKITHSQQDSYPIKHFYASYMPIIFQSVLLPCSRYSRNFMVNVQRKWKESEYSRQSIPVGDLAYYVTDPSRSNKWSCPDSVIPSCRRN